MSAYNHVSVKTPTHRSRPMQLTYLRSFAAVARELNFRMAANALSLTQSAVTKHIQNIEADIGVQLFDRNARSVHLTDAGMQLWQACAPTLEHLDHVVAQIRGELARPKVTVTTFASFASLWLIPRLADFQRRFPNIDININATDTHVDLACGHIDLALRFGAYAQMPKGAIRLFDEVITPVASRMFLHSHRIEAVEALGRYPLIEMSDTQSPQSQLPTWRGWLQAQRTRFPKTPRTLYVNYYYQVLQAALVGQGIALASMPLAAESLHNGDLQELFPNLRVTSALSYWLIARPGALKRTEVMAFSNWVQLQARLTRGRIGQSIHAKAPA